MTTQKHDPNREKIDANRGQDQPVAEKEDFRQREEFRARDTDRGQNPMERDESAGKKDMDQDDMKVNEPRRAEPTGEKEDRREDPGQGGGQKQTRQGAERATSEP